MYLNDTKLSVTILNVFKIKFIFILSVHYLNFPIN